MNEVTTTERLPEPLEYRGQRVITLQMMDELHSRPDGTAKRIWLEHRGKLREGEDYFIVTHQEWGNLGGTKNVPPRQHGGHRGERVLLTEFGYLVLVGSFTDELAWEVRRQVVYGYFRSKSISTELVLGGLAEQIQKGFQPVVEELREVTRGLANKSDGIRSDLDAFRQATTAKLEDNTAKLEDIQAFLRRGKRAEIKKEVRALHVSVLRSIGGKCPCCGEFDLLDQFGNRIAGQSEFDHFVSPAQGGLKQTWLIYKPCNRKFWHEPSGRQSKHIHFLAYQQRVDEWQLRQGGLQKEFQW